MNQKMSYSSQQQLKKTIAARLKAAGSELGGQIGSQLGGQLGAQVIRQLGGQPGKRQSAPPQQQAQPRQEVHTMPDGMSCAQDMHRADKAGIQGIYGGTDTKVLRQAVVLSEILAEPVCKRRHRRNRHTI